MSIFDTIGHTPLSLFEVDFWLVDRLLTYSIVKSVCGPTLTNFQLTRANSVWSVLGYFQVSPLIFHAQICQVSRRFLMFDSILLANQVHSYPRSI